MTEAHSQQTAVRSRARLLGAAVAFLAIASLAVVAAVGFGLVGAGANSDFADVLKVVSATRVQADGTRRLVDLPDEIESAPGLAAPVAARYEWQADLGASTAGRALYFPGLQAHARMQVNGQVLFDELAQTPGSRPRGGGVLRLVQLPESLLHPGLNEFVIDIAGRGWASLSPVWLGDHRQLGLMRERKAAALVTGPVVVATVIGCLGFSMLALAVRRSDEGTYGYFGAGAVFWSLHTFWTVSPDMLLPGEHASVWWNTLYAAWVILLVIFGLRFAQADSARVERLARRLLLATPVMLYGAMALGVLGPAADMLRLLLVAMAFATFGIVARHAWQRRSAASAMLLLAGAACAGLGLRDWLVFRAGDDNVPVPLTPYAGLPFIVLVSWILIDRFVQATESLEALNLQLEQRVAQREAELAEKYQRLARLESEHAATEERQRIMRDLHDGLGSQLFTSLSRVERGAIDHDGMAQVLRACIAEMRMALEAMASDEHDLRTALGNFLFRWETVLREAGIAPVWRIEVADGAQPVPPHVTLQLLRVLQEALTNTLRHANAATVQVELRQTADGTIDLSIKDDGTGLDVTESNVAGRGLANMRRRSQALDAVLTVQSRPGCTLIGLTMPPSRETRVGVPQTR